jgi:hypothetical protein
MEQGSSIKALPNSEVPRTMFVPGSSFNSFLHWRGNLLSELYLVKIHYRRKRKDDSRRQITAQHICTCSWPDPFPVPLAEIRVAVWSEHRAGSRSWFTGRLSAAALTELWICTQGKKHSLCHVCWRLSYLEQSPQCIWGTEKWRRSWEFHLWYS